MTNAGESFPHYGMDGTKVRSEALPIVDKTIMRTRSPYGLSFQYYAGEQLRRIQRQCGPKGSRSEGVQQLQTVEKRGVSLNPITYVKELNGGRNYQKEVVAYKAGRLLCIRLIFQISLANEVFLCAPLPMTWKILSLRPKTPFKSLLLKSLQS